MSNNKYEMGIGLSVVPYIGPDLYSNVPAVISELIANSWDSSSTEVKIDFDLKNDTITIEDNGNGMSLSELNNKYLRIGYKKRSEESSVFTVNGKQRHVMGRKGIGKLAPFALAEELEIHSANGQDDPVGCVIKWSEFKKAIDEDKSVFVPVPVASSKIKIRKGTKLILRLIRDDKKEDLEEISSLRKKIARRFTVIYPEYDFDVKIDGTSITDKDRPYLKKMEFVWCTANFNEKIKTRCPNLKRDPIIINNHITIGGKSYELSGWIGTVEEPKFVHDDKNDTISIFAHGKLVQEDMLIDMAERQIFASYVVGDIQADFLDTNEQDDIVTPDRQRLNHSDIRYIELKNFIKQDLMAKISSNWTFWRLERFVPKLPHIQAWYQQLKNRSTKTDAARIFKKIAELSIVDEAEINLFNEIMFSHFSELRNIDSLTNISENEFVNQLRQFAPQSARDIEAPEPYNAIPGTVETPNVPDVEGLPAAPAPVVEGQPPSPITPVTDAEYTVSERPEGTRPVNPKPPAYQAPYHFSEISKVIKQLPIEQNFIEVALIDLKNASLAYNNTAYKACIVMLGAVLEGVMLSTIRRSEVLLKLNQMPRQNFPQSVLNVGILSQPLNTTEVAEKISSSLYIGFEEYRKLIKLLIPDIENQLVTNIQHFRNSIHPYKVIKSPEIFADPDAARAILYIASLELITKKIAAWQPKV